MKKVLVSGLLLGSIVLLQACGSKDTNKQTQNNEPQIATTDKKQDNQVEKDANVLLDTVLKGDDNQFRTLYGKTYSGWTDELYNEATSEWLTKQDFIPESKFSYKYDGNEALAPGAIYKDFMQTRRGMIQTLGDYKIKDIKQKDDTATITFETRGLDATKIAEVTNSIKAKVIADDPYKKLNVKVYDNTQSDVEPKDDEVAKSKVDLLISYYLFYGNWSGKFDSLSENYREIPKTSEKEFTIKLTKTTSGNWLIGDNDYKEFISSLMVETNAINNNE